ncbi:MobV family relaxase [Paralcaligenes ureilyticus]|uniref:Plasmid recombination enzyme n=1 Tax=Paralcaligenes ureilyticus TaxID=627131 RepID=A0A4R3MBN9_9BURK|nr:MobV family relaxase [Paralcaligenes ureilyticus]TCT09669.1 plasmid recombination enzyme [Paralcaligenes ureilyticus]
MTSYTILRAEKLKSFGNIGGSLSHNYRARETPNADPHRTYKNKNSMRGPDEVMAAIKARLPERRRKDAVLCIEYLISCSQGALIGDKAYLAYLEDALRWLKERHGKDNVVAASVHFDETTPHLIGYVVPLKDGKLNAKAFLGGRQVLSKMQTDFAKKVGERHHLERGIERSTAKHTSIKEWYGLVNQATRSIKIPSFAVQPRIKKKRSLLPDIIETSDEVADRLNRTLDKLLKPILARAKVLAFQKKKADEIRDLVTLAQRRLADAEGRMRRVEQESSRFREVYEVLTPSEQKDLVQLAQRNLKIRQRCEKILSAACNNFRESVARFVAKAKDALSRVRGRWWDVRWSDLEHAYMQAERFLTSEREALKVILEHSPGQANASAMQAAEIIEAAVEKESQNTEGAPSASEPAQPAGHLHFKDSG